MPSAFDTKSLKIKKEINKFSILSADITAKPYPTPHLLLFKDLINEYQEILEKNLEKHLRPAFDSLTSDDEKEELISDFRWRIKRLFDILYNFFVTSQRVPRELYYLSDIFLTAHGERADYIICISDEIALIPLSHAILPLGFDSKYPEFWEKLNEKQFFFVQVIPELANTKASLNWPIVIHEIAHILCLRKKYDNEYYSAMSVFYALRTVESFEKGILKGSNEYDKYLLSLATKKLYATEILADLLVARYFGAIFGWCFLSEYVEKPDLFEPDRMHPYPDIRVQRIADEVKKQLNMPEVAALLKKELAQYKKTVLKSVKKRSTIPCSTAALKEIDQELNPLTTKIHANNQNALTYENIKIGIQDTAWFKTQKPWIRRRITSTELNKELSSFLQKLHKQILEGRPIVASPPIVYFIVTLGFNKEEFPKAENVIGSHILELIADLIRLYAVETIAFDK